MNFAKRCIWGNTQHTPQFALLVLIARFTRLRSWRWYMEKLRYLIVAYCSGIVLGIRKSEEYTWSKHKIGSIDGKTKQITTEKIYP